MYFHHSTLQNKSFVPFPPQLSPQNSTSVLPQRSMGLRKAPGCTQLARELSFKAPTWLHPFQDTKKDLKTYPPQKKRHPTKRKETNSLKGWLKVWNHCTETRATYPRDAFIQGKKTPQQPQNPWGILYWKFSMCILIMQKKNRFAIKHPMVNFSGPTPGKIATKVLKT